MPTLRKQLKDPIFRAWMAKQPRKDTNPPHDNWRVYVQREKGGRWARKDFHTYKEAYRFVLQNINKFHDMALSSKLYAFRPPIVRNKTTNKKAFHYPEAPGSKWCPFCRRMTKFKWFSRHHNVKSCYCGQFKQCEICGANVKFTQMREWKW